MAADVLAEIDGWFDAQIFKPLREDADAARAIAAMVEAVDRYFHSGQRICLVGVLALGASRDTFADQVQDYFKRWNDALALALRRSGLSAGVARRRSTDALITIQGALVLARASGDSRMFGQAMAEMTTRLLAKPD